MRVNIYIYIYIYIYNATVYPPPVLLNENEYIMPLWYPPHHFSSMGVNIYGHDISNPCIVVWEWIFNATPSYSIPNLVSYIVTLYFNSRPNLVWGWLYRYVIFWLHKICLGIITLWHYLFTTQKFGVSWLFHAEWRVLLFTYSPHETCR